MPNAQNQRPQFFEGQYLGSQDLDAAISYGRHQDSRHALGGHAWGIAIGLELKEVPVAGGADREVEISVTPGFAWDGFGRPIIIGEPVKISPNLFSAYRYDPSIDAPPAGTKGRLIDLWLKYHETDTQNVRQGFETCRGEPQYSRIQELFRFEVGPRPNHSAHDPVTVAGRSIDAAQGLSRFNDQAPIVFDESIPQQTFPSEDDVYDEWLIPIGKVRWLPVQNQAGHFVARDDAVSAPPDPNKMTDSDAIRNFRRYIGVVAETIHAADGAIRLRDRGMDPADPQKRFFRKPTGDLVWVEGNLRVEGDARIAGGKADFVETDGRNNNVPLQVRRSGSGGPGASVALQVVLGQDTQTKNRFAVGPLKVGTQTVTENFVVLSGGNVGIGLSAPENLLHVSASKHLNAIFERTDKSDHLTVVVGSAGSGLRFSDTNAFFVGSQTYANRNDSGFGTEHLRITATGNVGIGTSLPQSPLHVSAGKHLNAILEKTDSSDHLTLVVGSGGSGLRFSDSNSFFVASQPYANRNDTGFGIEHFRITASGLVGIGTNAPTQLLTVGSPEGTRLEVARVSSSIPWRSDGTLNPGSFVINQQSQGTAEPGADFALMRDRKKRVVLGDTHTYITSQGGGDVRLFRNFEESGELELVRISGGNVSIGVGTTANVSVNGGVTANGLTVTGSAQMTGNAGSAGFAPNSGYPTGWGGGVHTWDVYAEGSIGVGIGGSRVIELNSSGFARKPGGGPWTSSSDLRLKTNLQPLRSALKKLLRLRGIRFEWKDPQNMGGLVGPQMGLVAQEVEPVFPEWVSEDTDGYKELTIRGFEALVVEAIRDLRTECDEVKSLYEQLERKVKALESRGKKREKTKRGEA